MLAWCLHLQQARGVNVFFLGVLEIAIDDYNNRENRLQMEGTRTGCVNYRRSSIRSSLITG
jgi:hypothetical protein